MNARTRLIALIAALALGLFEATPVLASHGNSPSPLDQSINTIGDAINGALGTAGLPGQPTLGQVGGTETDSGSNGSGSGSNTPPATSGSGGGGGGGGGGGHD